MQRRVLRRYGRWLALAGMAIRLLVVAFHVPPAMAATEPEAASLFSQIILCTATGYRVVQLDENGEPVEPGQSTPLNAGVSCPICMALSAAPMAPAPAEIGVFAPRPLVLAVSEHRVALVTGRKPLVTRGRDPPTQA